MVEGRFVQFCVAAGNASGTCVFIIDEINRANLSRVFGELMYLLEYRGNAIPLAGGGTFSIPRNVRIIGTMNTADRSIALVDHALRRRFAFIGLRPDYTVLQAYHSRTGFEVDGLVDVLRTLNGEINDPHYEVGVTFFLLENLSEQIADVWKMEIEPYLEEYFFDQKDKVDRFRWAVVSPKVLQ
jgi:5-methylcytosine-specific restriction protein B